MSDQRAQLQRLLDLMAKHRERADDRETATGMADQRARAAAFDAARHRARIDALFYAVTLIRGISDEAERVAADPLRRNGDIHREYRDKLDDLAFRLLSEVDES